MKRFFFLLLLPFTLASQTFDLEQIEQIFRPRVRWDNRYIFPADFRDTSGQYGDFLSTAVITFPIKSKLEANLKLDLSSLKIKDILKNSVRIKASQTLGSLRVNYRKSHFGFDSIPDRTLYGISAGIMGVSLDKKFRVVFYNVTLNVSEEDKTFNKTAIRGSGVIGRFHLKGIRRNYYYGLALAYTDGLPLPIPFFGGSQPMGKHFTLNYTLPASLNVQYKHNKSSVFLGARVDGFRSGLQVKGKRVNINHTAGQAYLQYRQYFGNTVALRLEGGYYFHSSLNYTPQIGAYQNVFPVLPGPYASIGIHVLFGKNIFDRLKENFID